MMQGGNNTKKEEIKEPPKKINNLSFAFLKRYTFRFKIFEKYISKLVKL